METKKSEDTNYLRIILIVLAVLVAVTGVVLFTFYDKIFVVSEEEEEVQEGELVLGTKEVMVATEGTPEKEEAPEAEEKPVEEEEEPPAEEPEEALPEEPGRQFAEIELAAPPRPKESDEASLQLVKNYLTVTGGKAAHDQLQNVVARGTIKESTLLRNFQLIETQDGKRHLRYTWKFLGREYEELYVFDGLQAWSQKLKPKFEDAEPYSGPAGTHFIHHRWLLQPFVLPSVADYVFKYQGGAFVSGRPTHVVVGFGKKDERTWFYIDKEKFLLLRWGGFGPVAGKQEPMDYRSVRFKRAGGVLLPQEMDLIVEDDVFGKVRFEKIEANQSLDGINFTMPEATVPLLRQRPVEPSQ